MIPAIAVYLSLLALVAYDELKVLYHPDGHFSA